MDRRRLSFLFATLFLLCSVSFHRLPVSAATEESNSSRTRTPITHNLFYSNYSSATYYRNTDINDAFEGNPIYIDDGLQMRANCYGYAYRFYYRPLTFENGKNYYKQQPGEFANKASGLHIYDTFGELLITLYDYEDLNWIYTNVVISRIYSASEKMDIIIQLMNADASTLGYTLTPCLASSVGNSQTYSSKRLIAIVTGPSDYHFYLQHSDGTWSHKPGDEVPDDDCFCGSNLTNDSITTHALEDQYAGGCLRFFYITKNAIIDYGHGNGHSGNNTKTSLSLTDSAGNDFQTSNNLGSISSITKNGYIDFRNDVDYYYFTPTSTKTYSFTSTTSSSLPLKIVLYDAFGVELTSQTSNTGTVSFSYQLNSGLRYYIKISTVNQTTHEHSRTYTFSIT